MFYLRVWRRNDTRGLEEKKEYVEEIDDIERKKIWGLIFFS